MTNYNQKKNAVMFSSEHAVSKVPYTVAKKCKKDS